MDEIKEKGGNSRFNQIMSTSKGVNAFLLNMQLIYSDAHSKGDTDALIMVLDFQDVFQGIEKTVRQSEAFELVYIKGLNQREAGEEMGVSQQAVQQLIKSVIVRIAEGFQSKGVTVNVG